MAADVIEQIVRTGAARLCAADLVDLLVNDLKAPLLGQCPQVEELAFEMLVAGRNAEVYGGAFH